jgi:hypothetical protein
MQPDWGELATRLGAQLPPLRERDLAVPLPPPPKCARCGKPAVRGRMTREHGPLCRSCDNHLHPDLQLHHSTLGPRVEELVWQARRRYEWLRTNRDGLRYERRAGPGKTARKWRPAGEIDRLVLRAHGRYWRRVRMWLTGCDYRNRPCCETPGVYPCSKSGR